MRRLSLSIAAVAAAFLLPVAAQSADLTDVLDFADGDDPFDITVQVEYRRALRRAKITREYNCQPSVRPQDFETCGDAPPSGELLQVKELRYERITHEVVPTVRVGLWHDLELAIEFPVTISDDQSLRFAGDGGETGGVPVTPDNSSVAPGETNGIDPVNLFDVPLNGLPTRAGFGDMQIMLRYSPISEERDDQRGNWTLEFGYRIPTGETMEHGNEGVGRGVHELTMATSLSRRFSHLDPYARFAVMVPFAADDSLFKDYGDAQEHVGPGTRTQLALGSEIIAFEDTAKGVKFYFDLGFDMTYHAEGRDYSELFDALAIGAQACDPAGPSGDLNCGRYNPDSQSSLADQPHDGITTVEEHMTLGGHLGVGVYASSHFKLGAQVGLSHDTEHFISSADIGQDLDGSGMVEAQQSAGYSAAEHNPTYVPAIDGIGRRLRIEETTVFTASGNMQIMF